jgi:hypothetical protein
MLRSQTTGKPAPQRVCRRVRGDIYFSIISSPKLLCIRTRALQTIDEINDVLKAAIVVAGIVYRSALPIECS